MLLWEVEYINSRGQVNKKNVFTVWFTQCKTVLRNSNQCFHNYEVLIRIQWRTRQDLFLFLEKEMVHGRNYQIDKTHWTQEIPLNVDWWRMLVCEVESCLLSLLSLIFDHFWRQNIGPLTCTCLDYAFMLIFCRDIYYTHEGAIMVRGYKPKKKETEQKGWDRIVVLHWDFCVIVCLENCFQKLLFHIAGSKSSVLHNKCGACASVFCQPN